MPVNDDGGDMILENDRSPPLLSLPRGASTCMRGDRQKCLDATALAFKRVDET